MKNRPCVIIALLLSAALLAGCGGQSETAAPEDGSLFDYAAAFAAHRPGDTVLTVDGEAVSWRQYFALLYRPVHYLDYNNSLAAEEPELYGDGAFAGWEEDCPFDDLGRSNADYCRESAGQNAIYCALVSAKAEELGAGLTGEQSAGAESFWQEAVEQLGGCEEDALLAALGDMYLDKDTYIYNYYTVIQLYDNLLAATLGEHGSACSDGEVLTYAEDKGYLRAKEIYIAIAEDSDGTAEKALAESCLEALRGLGGEALERQFDALAAEHSDQEALAAYPEGYCFTQGVLEDEVYNALAAVEPGESTGVVETSGGFYILLRRELSPEAACLPDAEDAVYPLREAVAQQMFSALVDSWVGEADIKYSYIYENLDPAKLF